MLHNVLLKAGFSTEIAKQGRFLNVVLAAGEVEARIRLVTGEVLQTNIVSGMAFPVSQGFISVSFLSGETQKVKVWLGDLPLTYSPIESKIVGSTALISTVAKASFGDAKQLLPERVGRKSLTINSSKSLFVGSSDVRPSSAIEIPANTNFTLDTQAALWGYSSDKTDKTQLVADLSKGLVDEPSVFFAGVNVNKGFITYMDYIGMYALVGGGGFLELRGINETEYKTLITDVDGNGTFGRFSNGDLVCYKNTSLKVISALDGTLRSIGTFFPASTDRITVDSNSDNIASFQSASMVLHTGNEINGLTEKAHPLTSTPDVKLVSLIYSATGKLIILSLNHYCISPDNGLTWGLVQDLPSNYGQASVGSLGADMLSGAIYYGDVNGDLYKSSNDGVSFELVKVSALGWSGLPMIEAIHCVGDSVAITNGGGTCYSLDGGETWVDIIYDAYQSTVNGIVISPDGILSTHRKRHRYLKASSTALVGGLSVRVLEEIN
jgi:hypothetical protein